MRNTRLLFVVLIVAALLAGSVALAAKPPKPTTKCPFWDLMCLDVWDPVQCNDGKIYSNACYAKRVCAKGCKPIGGGPVPL